MTKHKVGIIGDGNFGSALERGLMRAGHDVRVVGDDDSAISKTITWADLVVLAVPFGALDSVADVADGTLAGKTVVDVTDALDDDMNLALHFTTSGAEELQKKLPKAHVVKAFNTVFARHMDSGKLGDRLQARARHRGRMSARPVLEPEGQYGNREHSSNS